MKEKVINYATSWHVVTMDFFITALNFYDFFKNQYCSNLLKKTDGERVNRIAPAHTYLHAQE